MKSNLLQRPNGRFYARIVVPKSLRKALGKTELTRALGADRRTANELLPGVLASMRAELKAARENEKSKVVQRLASRPGKTLSFQQMALAHYQDQIQFDEELRNTRPEYALGFYDEKEVDRLQSVISGAATNEEMRLAVGLIIDKFRASRNTDIDYDHPDFRPLSRVLAVAQLEAIKRQAERDDGDFTGKPDHPALQPESTTAKAPADPVNARLIGPDSDKPLSQLMEKFLTERKSSESTNYECYVSLRMFEEAQGEDMPAYRVTRSVMQDFKRKLAETPANYAKRFPNTALPDAIEKNKKLNAPFPVLSAKTINDKYLSKLHSFFNWCASNDIVPDNPVAGVKVARSSDDEAAREHFRPTDLTKIFAPKHFATDGKLGEFEWATLISLFSGLRASELAQMQLDSIRTQQGILCFAVEESTKNQSSKRLVPVHSQLIALGLETYVARLRKKGETHLFPVWYAKGMKAKADAQDKAASKGKNAATLNHYFPRFIPKVFNNAHRSAVGIHDPKKTWHSFRHTFKTGLAQAGVIRSTRDDICGHSDNSAGAAYVHDTSVEAMRDAIEKLKFDGLDLSHLK